MPQLCTFDTRLPGLRVPASASPRGGECSLVSACAGRCSASACSSRPPLLPQPHEKRWPCLRSCLSPGRLSHTWGTASGSRPEPEGRCPGPASLLCIPSDVALMGVVAGCSRGSVVSPGSFQTSVKTSTEFACGGWESRGRNCQERVGCAGLNENSVRKFPSLGPVLAGSFPARGSRPPRALRTPSLQCAPRSLPSCRPGSPAFLAARPCPACCRAPFSALATH